MSEEAPGKRYESLKAALHLIVLWGLAVAQPIYDLLARHSGFFVVRRSEPADVLILAGVLSFLLPAAVAGILAILRWVHRSAGVLCHRIAVAVLIAVLALQVVKRLVEPPGWMALALAAGAGVAGVAAYHRLAAARLFLTLLTPAIAVFPAVFLLDPSVSKIVRPRHVEAIADLEVRPDTFAAETPVIMIVFDALPLTSLMNGAGEIDSVRFPSFASLATSATWYRGATTVSVDTIWALPAILTGTYPDVSLQPSFRDHPRNLFTLLGDSYQLTLFEDLTDLCPAELCPRTITPLAQRLRDLASDLHVVFLHVLLPADLTGSLPQISQTWNDFAIRDAKLDKRNRSRMFRGFLGSIDPPRPRGLYFLHSLFPHAPYQYMPSGKQYTRVRQDIGRQAVLQGRWSDDEGAVLQHYRRHLLQVGMADKLLGHTLERLRETDFFDRSLIVVTADHGVSFRPGDYRRKLTETNFMDVMPVPLLIKRPGQTAGEIDDRNVETIDVLPTIADLLGLDLPWPVDGVSADDASRPERPTKICYGEAASITGELELPSAAFEATLAATRRKEQILGDGDFADLLRGGPYPELVGRSIEELAVGEGSGGLFAKLASPSLFREVDPTSSFVPALVEGFVGPAGELEPPLDLAIGINGAVAATTRTRSDPLGGGLLAFSALAPETAFRPGANDVEVLVIRRTEPRLAPQKPELAARLSGPTHPDYESVAIRNRLLVRAKRDDRRALYTGMRLGSEQVWGVKEAGFHEPERLGAAPPSAGTMIRWTQGVAQLVVPLGPGPPPARLRVDLALTGKQGNELAISAGGHELFRGQLPPGAWSQTFDLQAVDLAGEAVIELTSDTFVPERVLEGSRDARTLGVAVEGVWLEN